MSYSPFEFRQGSLRKILDRKSFLRMKVCPGISKLTACFNYDYVAAYG